MRFLICLMLLLVANARCSAQEALSPAQSAMLDFSTGIRLTHKLTPTRPNHSLMVAAQRHAEHLASIGFSVDNLLKDPHNEAGDGTPAQRARAAGFTGSLLTPPDATGWSTVGEVIAPRYTYDPASPFAGWLDSPKHRKSLLHGGFDVCGFGHASNRAGHVWVAIFGTGSPQTDSHPAVVEQPPASLPVASSQVKQPACQALPVAEASHSGPLPRLRGAVRGAGRRLVRPLFGRLRGGC